MGEVGEGGEGGEGVRWVRGGISWSIGFKVAYSCLPPVTIFAYRPMTFSLHYALGPTRID